MRQNTCQRFDFGDILCHCAPLDSLKILEVNTNPFFTQPPNQKGQPRPMIRFGGEFYKDGSIDKALDGLVSLPTNFTDVQFTLA